MVLCSNDELRRRRPRSLSKIQTFVGPRLSKEFFLLGWLSNVCELRSSSPEFCDWAYNKYSDSRETPGNYKHFRHASSCLPIATGILMNNWHNCKMGKGAIIALLLVMIPCMEACPYYCFFWESNCKRTKKMYNQLVNLDLKAGNNQINNVRVSAPVLDIRYPDVSVLDYRATNS